MNYVICYLFHGKVKSLNKGKNGNHLAATIKYFPRGMLRRVLRKKARAKITNAIYVTEQLSVKKNILAGERPRTANMSSLPN